MRDPSADRVGRSFSSAAVELALSSYPGFTMTAPPGPATAYGVFRPAYIDRSAARETVHLPDGTVRVVDDPPVSAEPAAADAAVTPVPRPARRAFDGPTRRTPLGAVAEARSGDKGGDAIIGLWVSSTTAHAAECEAWLASYLTPERVRDLLPEAEHLAVDVHPMPNLHGLVVVVHGLLGEGVAASTRFDPQAKALGEWLRSRLVDLPEELL